MSKRKQKAPQRATDEKRKCMTWNMLDGANETPPGSLLVLDDNDPSLLHEVQQAQGPSTSKDCVSAGGKKVTGNGSSTGLTPDEKQVRFENNLKYCPYSLKVLRGDAFGKNEWHAMLGAFSVKIINEKNNMCGVPDWDPPNGGELWLYMSEIAGKSMLYMEFDENDENHPETSDKDQSFKFWCVHIDLPFEVFGGLHEYNLKMAAVIYQHYDPDTLSLEMTIHARHGILSNPKFPSEVQRVRKSKQAILLQKVMSYFYGLAPPECDENHDTSSKKHDIDALYNVIWEMHKKDEVVIDVDVQHPSLIPYLRPYQRKGVAWMLSRERFQHNNSASPELSLHMLYDEVTTPDGRILYYNKYLGSMTLERQLTVMPLPGGILADEMGLGKTVEVLACMLLHRSSETGCPPCLPTASTTQTVDIGMCDTQNMSEGQGDVKVKVETSTVFDTQQDFPCQQNTPTIMADTEIKTEGQHDREAILSSCDIETDTRCRTRVARKNSVTKKSANKQLENMSQGAFETHGKDITDKLHDRDDKLCLSASSDVQIDNKSQSEEERRKKDKINFAKADGCDSVIDKSTPSFVCDNDDPSLKVVSVGTEFIDMSEGNSDITAKDIVNGKEMMTANITGDSVEIPSAHMKSIKETDNQTNCKGSENGEENSVSSAVEIDRIEDAGMAVTKTKDKKRKKRKSWTWKKKSHRSSQSTSSSVDDEGNQDLGEVNGVENHEEGSKELDSSEKTKTGNANKKKKRIPSRFVEYVEEANFKPVNYFSTSIPAKQKEFFECICGVKKIRADDKKSPVQCITCGLWQHSECVHYNLDDPFRGEFKCPHCHVSQEPIKSGATLIISPSSICHQWVDEILKHIRSQSLKVFVYTGVNKLGFIQPRTLAQQDIVITTYETLRKEIDYVDLPHSNSETGRKFRHPKRFMAIPSPITAVEWWRICLDEAQMVECTTTKTAEMALRLSAVNRWCVTGTPIQKSVSDLYGLLLFLGLDPYWVNHWWSKLLYEPFCCGSPGPLQEVVAKVLWRNAKKDVLDQIDIPEQTEHVHWLTFSPMEDHFYRRQYVDCKTECRKRFSGWTDPNIKLSSLDRHTVSKLLAPLLRLRQACCHPQAVKGEFLPLQKTTMTMEQLLESLIKKVKVECEESHRQLVASLNGMAGLHIIKDELVEAVDKYREVLWSVMEHKDQLRTDALQQLHALHNLHEVLSLKPKGVSPTLRDDMLKQQSEELKENYMSKAAAKVTAHQKTLVPTQQTLTHLRAQFRHGREWWLELIKYAEKQQTDAVLVEMVKAELNRDYVDDPVNPHVSIARLFRSSNGLQLTLHSRLVALESAHEKLLEGIQQLCEPVTKDMVVKAAECCLRPVQEPLHSCQLCQVEKLFQDYESKLFSFTKQPLTSVDRDQPQQQSKRQGTWADSELEKALKVILNFARLYRANRDLIEFGSIHIKVFDTLKKEFRNLRLVWIAKHEQFQAMDEVDMAITRLRLRLPDEAAPDTTQLNIIEERELGQQKLKLETERTVAKNELRKKLGQLYYLENLSKTKLDNEDGVNPEPCPICQRELGVEWSVLQCGHCYCLDCIRVMVVQFSFGNHNRRLKCAICRQMTFHSDISYVSTKASEDGMGTDDIRVKGSYSTKIEGVVRCLLNIHKNDPKAKVLVFSTWNSVLGIIGKALTENNISYRTLYTGKFQDQLTSFREEEDVTTLLLPIQSGANGLNLIEATYVLLVEPILNPAQELQAIGRVHRIGQTRKTQVHRFIVRGTIEQKMYAMLKTIEDTPSSHNTEENVLTIGQLTSLFQEEREEEGAGNTEDMSVTDTETQETAVENVTLPASSISEPNLADNTDVIQATSTPEENPTLPADVFVLSSDEGSRDSDVMHCTSNSEMSRESGGLSEADQGPIIEVVSVDDDSCEPISEVVTVDDDSYEPMNEAVTIDVDNFEPMNETVTVDSDEPINEAVTVDVDNCEPMNETVTVDDDSPEPLSEVVTIDDDSCEPIVVPSYDTEIQSSVIEEVVLSNDCDDQSQPDSLILHLDISSEECNSPDTQYVVDGDIDTDETSQGKY